MQEVIQVNVSFQFTVWGTPVPQGSMRAFIIKKTGRAIVTSSNKKVKPWRNEVAGAALQAIEVYGFPPMMNAEPVQMEVEFFFDKPKSVKGNFKVTKPDMDKLLRAIFDALTGVAYKDDSQVVRCILTKQYGYPPCVKVKVSSPDLIQQSIPLEETCKAFGADWA